MNDDGTFYNSIEALLPFYTLGTLTDDEMATVKRYLAANPQVAKGMIELKKTVSALNYLPAPLPPTSAVKRQLLARIQAAQNAPAVEPTDIGGDIDQALSHNDRQPSSQPFGQTTTPGRIWSGIRFALIPLAAAAAVFALLYFGWIKPLENQVQSLAQINKNLNDAVATQSDQLILLSTELEPLQNTNDTLQQNLTEQEAQIATLTAHLATILGDDDSVMSMLADQSQDLAYLSTVVEQISRENAFIEQQLREQRSAMVWATVPNVQSIALASTEPQVAAHGQLVVNPLSDTGVLIVTGLSPLNSGQVYQLWFVQDGQFIPSEVFSVDETGLGIMRINQQTQFASFDGMGITVEPEGGSEQPTEDMVLQGSL